MHELTSNKSVSTSTHKHTDETHIVIEAFDDTSVDQDSSGNTVENPDREQRSARVWVIASVNAHPNGDTDRRDQLEEKGLVQHEANRPRVKKRNRLTPKVTAINHFLYPWPAFQTSCPILLPSARPSKSWWKTMAMKRGIHWSPPEAPSETPIMILRIVGSNQRCHNRA